MVLVTLGFENMRLRARWHEVEDGVLWSDLAEGVTAKEVASGSAGDLAGIRRGDVLIGVDGKPIRTPADVVEFHHRAHEGTRLSYQLLRLGTRQVLDVSLAPTLQASSMYFVLASVGLFTLLVGAAVRVRRPRDQATLHFFWLCVAFFGAFTFSFNGPFDRLDWVFYWGDAIATPLLAPLLVHFMLVFPERPAGRERSRPAALFVPLLYVPAAAIAASRIVALTRGAASARLRVVRHRPARQRAARLPLRVRRGGARRSVPGVSRADVAHRAPPAPVDCLGHGARRRPVCVRIRAAVGARLESAVCVAADRASARFRPADLRVRDRQVSPPRRGSHRQARSGVRRLSRRQRRAVCGHAPPRRVRLCRGSRIRATGSSRASPLSPSCCCCNRSRKRCRTRWIACSTATVTTTAARSSASRAISTRISTSCVSASVWSRASSRRWSWIAWR